MDFILSVLPLPDLVAVLWLLACWGSYNLVADKIGRHHRKLAQAMDAYRLSWMQRMLERDNRMADVNIVIAHHRSGALFASTTILILAGIVAVLGNVDRLVVVIDQLSFATLASRELIELKVVMLLLIFAYAFFKFAWCLRQFNNTLVLIGAAPMATESASETAVGFPPKVARILTRANTTFLRGMRAYYFGLATLAWFLHPYLFMAATVLVVLVQYRRDFHSAMLKALVD